ncbi:transcription regulator AraC family [Clostridium aceticum]|uniref:Transcription regulator AraC family n=1 Tax=Clostridium aceticum TaxID=84022 RepID=A0A0G3WHE0_9CLOT|nr:AraC family transcriptional regulator [Clostridium aceticum]AKL97315.1 transcription regulator AraC family [Clostridium aceticum]
MKGIHYYRTDAWNMIEVKTCANDMHAYKDHLHQELSIGYIEKGATKLYVSGKNYDIGAGEAVIMYPYVSHRCQPLDINEWQFTMIYIENEFCKGIFDDLEEKHSIGIKKLGEQEFNQIRYLADVLKSDVSGFHKEVELISTLIQLFSTCDVGIKLESVGKINEIKTYIEGHYLQHLNLKDMEKHFSINKFALIRGFKNKFNTTPSAYQLQLKINYGKYLLKSSNNIADIALKSGFYDQAHFTKEFKKAYGVTPLQYYKSL